MKPPQMLFGAVASAIERRVQTLCRASGFDGVEPSDKGSAAIHYTWHQSPPMGGLARLGFVHTAACPPVWTVAAVEALGQQLFLELRKSIWDAGGWQQGSISFPVGIRVTMAAAADDSVPARECTCTMTAWYTAPAVRLAAAGPASRL